jgi:hypothetical protein
MNPAPPVTTIMHASRCRPSRRSGYRVGSVAV